MEDGARRRGQPQKAAHPPNCADQNISPRCHRPPCRSSPWAGMRALPAPPTLRSLQVGLLHEPHSPLAAGSGAHTTWCPPSLPADRIGPSLKSALVYTLSVGATGLALRHARAHAGRHAHTYVHNARADLCWQARTHALKQARAHARTYAYMHACMQHAGANASRMHARTHSARMHAYCIRMHAYILCTHARALAGARTQGILTIPRCRSCRSAAPGCTACCSMRTRCWRWPACCWTGTAWGRCVRDRAAAARHQRSACVGAASHPAGTACT